MVKYSHIQDNFNAGEWGPLTYARVTGDIAGLRAASLKLCENFIPTLQGPLRKRQGSRFGKLCNTSTEASRLVPYVPGAGTAGVLELADATGKVLSASGTLVAGTVATPYTVANSQIFEVQYAQAGAQLWLTHPAYPPQHVVSDVTATSTLTVPSFDFGPLQAENTTATTMTASAVSGTGITLTASASSFTADMTPGSLGAAAGQLVAFRCIPQALHAQWATSTSYTAGDYVWSSSYETPGRINVYKATTTGSSGALAPGHDSGTESDGGVSWQMVHTEYGFARITAYSSGTSVTADVVGFPELPSDSTSGVTRWSWGSFSREFGFPRSVAFFQQRAIFAGTETEPQTFWGSKIGSYTDFLPGQTGDDQAFSYELSSDIAVPIRFLLPGRVLMIGTTGGEFFASGPNGGTITPTSIEVQRDTRHGSVSQNAVQVGPSFVFIQQGRKTIREARFNDVEQAYNANNIGLLASHITSDLEGWSRQLVGLAYQAEPDSVIWTTGGPSAGVPSAYGSQWLIGVTFDRQFQATGWHRHVIAGATAVFSPIVVPQTDGSDRLLYVVRRTINGATQHSIEWIDDGEQQLHQGLDAAVKVFATAGQTVVTGLSHLEGETVTAVVAPLAEATTVGRTTPWKVYPNLTVASGQVTLPVAAGAVEPIVVGLPYTAKAETQEPEGGSDNGTSQAKAKRVTGLRFRVHNTAVGLYAASTRNGTLEQILYRDADDPMDAGVPLFSGDTEATALESEYSDGAVIYFEHNLPGPCTISAVLPQIEVQDDR